MGISRHDSRVFFPKNISHSSGIAELGTTHDHPIHEYSRSCTLNSTTSLMPLFVSPFSCLADPSTPSVYIPATHFAFRPKLIGLRIGRLELFILCPAINQFLRRPNRGRKDRTAMRATKRRTTSGYSHQTKRALAKIEQTNLEEGEQRGTRRRRCHGMEVS